VRLVLSMDSSSVLLERDEAEELIADLSSDLGVVERRQHFDDIRAGSVDAGAGAQVAQ